MKPLQISIPLEYADALGVDRSFLTHVNRGRRRLSPLVALKLLELAADDPRLSGVTIHMLRPEAQEYQKFFRKEFLKKIRKLGRKCKKSKCPILLSRSLNKL